MAIEYSEDAVDVITIQSPKDTVSIELEVAGFQGPAGPAGSAGPPNILSMGTVSTGTGGSLAAAEITGNYPDQKLHLTIPSGQDSYIEIGTVATGAAGTMASAYMSGQTPNQLLNLVLPTGQTGQGVVVLGPNDPVPDGTPAGSVIFRTT